MLLLAVRFIAPGEAMRSIRPLTPGFFVTAGSDGACSVAGEREGEGKGEARTEEEEEDGNGCWRSGTPLCGGGCGMEVSDGGGGCCCCCCCWASTACGCMESRTMVGGASGVGMVLAAGSAMVPTGMWDCGREAREGGLQAVGGQ